MTTPKLDMVKDPSNKKLTVTRRFNAPIADVWRAWTESEILDQWWGPKPWRAETKEMDFRVGGHWLYAMVGPEGEKHWARADYTAIDPQTSFSGLEGFCDENGVINPGMPRSQWHRRFEEDGDGTTVIQEETFESEEALQMVLEMGFEEGFATGLRQLDDYFKSKP